MDALTLDMFLSPIPKDLPLVSNQKMELCLKMHNLAAKYPNLHWFSPKKDKLIFGDLVPSRLNLVYRKGLTLPH